MISSQRSKHHWNNLDWLVITLINNYQPLKHHTLKLIIKLHHYKLVYNKII